MPASALTARARSDVALVISRGFGGTNAALLVARQLSRMADRWPQSATRCGIDTVEIARMERLLRETSPEDLLKIFSPEELRDSGVGPGARRACAARFAAKEACLKLFPRETALGSIGAADFSVARDSYGAPQTRRKRLTRRMCSIGIVSARSPYR